jgi:hypothetical protein
MTGGGDFGVKVIDRIEPELLSYLDGYRNWVFKPQVQQHLFARMSSSSPRFKAAGRPEDACAVETLRSIQHALHNGFPEDFYGIDLNYKNVQNESAQFAADFFAEVRAINNDIDDKLQTFLGAKSCALKAFYPAQGYISWHTNWNVPGYVLIFSHSQNGRGYWRHIDSAGARSLTPDSSKLVQIDDKPGWHCKAGYFGGKDELDRLVWHCAYSDEPRITLSYLIKDEHVWQDIIAEMTGR